METNVTKSRDEMLFDQEVMLIRRGLLLALGSILAGLFVFSFLLLFSLHLPLAHSQLWGWMAAMVGIGISMVVLGIYQVIPIYWRKRHLRDHDEEMFP